MKIQEIKDMNNEQLKKLIAEKQTQAVKLRFDIAARQVKNHRQYRVLKTDIARALTILNQRIEQK
ncbi:MAG: 50S ribosomal protein L29 [Candidatus Moranbacteria bacterium]|nr:50S ribosomal protein L29 [Candidatus Moranbacteria bacterium]